MGPATKQLIPLQFKAGAVTWGQGAAGTVLLDAVHKSATLNAQTARDGGLVFGVDLQQADGVSITDLQIGYVAKYFSISCAQPDGKAPAAHMEAIANCPCLCKTTADVLVFRVSVHNVHCICLQLWG